MPRHDLKKLQTRLHWIEDYASGLSSTQIVAKYVSDGATERKFRTAREAALGIGLLRQDEDVIGSGFKIDHDIMNRINSSKQNKNSDTDQTATQINNASKRNENEYNVSDDILNIDEVKVLKEIANKWKARNTAPTDKNNTTRNSAHWIKLNKPLFEMCKIHAKNENISLDHLVTSALMEYLRINHSSIKSDIQT